MSTSTTTPRTAPATRPRGRTATLPSLVLAAAATLVPPTVVLCGVPALVLAAVGWRRGDRPGRVALGTAVVVLVVGLVTGGLLALAEELGLRDTGWGG